MGCRESFSLDFIQKQCVIGESVTMSQAAKGTKQRASGFMIQDTAISSWKCGPTEQELVTLHHLEHGSLGMGFLSGLARVHDYSFHYSVSDQRLKHGIQVQEKCCTHQHHWNGSTHPKCYWPAKREQTNKVTKLVNHKLHRTNILSLEQMKNHRCLSELRSNPTMFFVARNETRPHLEDLSLFFNRRRPGEMTA